MPTNKPIETEVLPPESGLSTATAEALHNQYHRCAQAAAAQATGYAILCGLELKQIRKKLAKPGKRSDLSHSSGGGWAGWVKDNCEFGAETARKYIAVADGVSGRIGAKLDGLMELAPSAMDTDQHQKLLKTVSKSTQGQSLQQLYLDFGIIKANPTDNLRKGGATHTKGRGNTADLDEQDARALANEFIHLMAKWLNDGHHQHLPRKDVEHLDQQLLAARETLKPFLKKS